LFHIKLFRIYFQVLPQVNPFSFGEDEFNLDDTVTATCSVTKGDTQGLKIYWVFQGIEDLFPYNISTNDGIVITKPSQKMSILGIEAVKARHRGNYTCIAQNRAGISQQSSYLYMNGAFKYFLTLSILNLQRILQFVSKSFLP
jgi:Immunoglobulin domain